MAPIAGGICLCMLLLVCVPPEASHRVQPETELTIRSTALPTNQSLETVGSNPNATDFGLLAAHITPSAVSNAIAAPRATLMPSIPALAAPTGTSVPVPTAAQWHTSIRVPGAGANHGIIVDHTTTGITAVPQEWIEKSKQVLHIGYGRTSHGRQLVTGMAGLVPFANGGGLRLSLPTNIFQFSPGGNEGADYSHLFEGAGWDEGELRGDVGDYPGWVAETRDYLGEPDPTTGRGRNHPEMNVIIWSWCVQLSYYTEEQTRDEYLLPMSELEAKYPGITFVYMTGTWNGMMGDEVNLRGRNQQIRDYCTENGKVLYDYRDIELYDPDGHYYGDRAVTDVCEYDSDSDGEPDGNWCLEWQNANTKGEDWYTCECPHSYPINCNQKAYAAWWLWARLAGWDGN